MGHNFTRMSGQTPPYSGGQYFQVRDWGGEFIHEPLVCCLSSVTRFARARQLSTWPECQGAIAAAQRLLPGIDGAPLKNALPVFAGILRTISRNVMLRLWCSHPPG
jgi:hypothetical protein